MKINEIKANFSKIEFHKPTSNMTGVGVQITGNRNGSIVVQMAKQITENTPKQKATYGWTDKTKNIKFILSADEVREVVSLIRLALRGKTDLFINGTHNKFDKDGDFSKVNKYHNNTYNTKNIIFLTKEYRNEIQLEMCVTQKEQGQNNLTLSFSFSKTEMQKLEMLLYLHQGREMPVPEGIMSCVVDESREVLKQDYMPNMSVGDFIVMPVKDSDSDTLKNKTLKIKTKTFITKYNMIVYSV